MPAKEPSACPSDGDLAAVEGPDGFDRGRGGLRGGGQAERRDARRSANRHADRTRPTASRRAGARADMSRGVVRIDRERDGGAISYAGRVRRGDRRSPAGERDRAGPAAAGQTVAGEERTERASPKVSWCAFQSGRLRSPIQLAS